MLIAIIVWLYLCCCVSVLDLASGASAWRKCLLVPFAPLIISWAIFAVGVERLNDLIGGNQ